MLFKTKQLTLFSFPWLTFKNILSPYESKKIFEYADNENIIYQLRIRDEICILLKIIQNSFKCFTVSLPLKSLLWLISASILCELAMLLNVYILLTVPSEKNLSPQICISEWADVYIWKHINQKDWTLHRSLYQYALVILKKDCKASYFLIGPPCVDFW